MMTSDEWQRVLFREQILAKRRTVVLVRGEFSEHLDQDSLTIQKEMID
jgi:hypothetical protein